MSSGGGFDLEGAGYNFGGLGAYEYGLRTFEGIQQAVNNELFSSSIAEALGVPPVTRRDVSSAVPGGVIDTFLRANFGVGIEPMSAPFFDAAACNADPICADAIRNAINASPVAYAMVNAAIESSPELKAAVSAQINADPMLQAQVARQIANETALAMSGPVGGAMSSPFLGFNSIQPAFTGSPLGPTQPDSFFPEPSSGGIVGSILGAIPSVLTGLAQAGVIRGSVGQALAPQPMVPSAVGMTPAGFFPSATLPAVLGALPSLPTLGGIATTINAGSAAMNMLSGLSSFFTSSPKCGASRPPVSAPTLFRMTPCGGMRLPARQQVIGPDGSLYVIQSLGKATRGSREQSAMRRLARDNGFVVSRRGGARGSRRRSSYRRPR